MPTTDNDARLAEIRSAAEYGKPVRTTRAYVQDIHFLLAEIDRLRAELATVTDERDESQLQVLIGERHFEQWEAVYKETCAELDALRRAHTWTDATPATMPPVGSGRGWWSSHAGRSTASATWCKGISRNLGHL